MKEALTDADWQGNSVDNILLELKKTEALRYEKPDPLYIGAPVLALLLEDGEWHPAILKDIQHQNNDEDENAATKTQYHVVFTEYEKPQVCGQGDVVAVADVLGDAAGESLGVGDCELCARTMDVTFHHLVPKETHKRYLKKKKLPHNLNAGDVVRSAKGECSSDVEEGNDGGSAGRLRGCVMLKVECTSLFFNSYGASLCRPCHSFIHSAEDNIQLAEHYNTVELLLSHDKVATWVQYASKQKVFQKCKRGKKIAKKRVTFDHTWDD